MFIKQNLHTHCTFCDGRDTPEEMIAELERLIEKYPEVVRLKVAGA